MPRDANMENVPTTEIVYSFSGFETTETVANNMLASYLKRLREDFGYTVIRVGNNMHNENV